jgi:glycine cleavage system H protein
VDRRKNYYQIIPKEEIKCVWMTAGLLTYKLCKYDLQCEKCPLDWELRNVSARPFLDSAAPEGSERGNSEETRVKRPGRKEWLEGDVSTEDLSRLTINGSLFYHPGHTWVKVEKADEVRIGIDYFLAKIMGRAKVIVLPLPGRRCVQGENLCSIIQEHGILNIVFPVSGSVLSVNQRLKDEPELVTKNPLEEGFLVTLRPRNLQRDQRHLFSGQTALSWYQKELERFKTAVVSEPSADRKGLGATMQDGEMKLGEIGKLMDTERYIQLVSTFLRKGEKAFLTAR